MTASSPSPAASFLGRTVVMALWLVAGVTAGYHLYVHARTIPLAEPMGMWETNYVSIARHWPDQYQLGNFVLGHDNYGPGYPFFCRPFIALFADIYVAHRIANLVALLAACGVLGWILRANRCSPVITAATLALFYALQEGSYSVQARPDFLVSFWMLLAFALGQPSVQARRSAAVLGSLLGLAALAAYLTKPYGAFAWGVGPAYLLLTGHWRRALVTGGVSGAILAGGIALYAARNPYYLFETFTAHLAHTDPDFHWLLAQVRDFSGLTAGVLVIALTGGVLLVRGGNAADEPSPNSRYWAFVTLAATAALLAGPGWHLGAYLTYFFNLLAPALLIFAALECSRRTTEYPWRGLLLAANLGILLFLAPPPPAPDPGWDKLTADVLRQPGRVLVDFILEPVTRQRSDVVTLGMGTTAFALAEPLAVKGNAPVTVRARQEAEAYEANLKAQLTADSLPTALYLEYVVLPNPQDPAHPSLVPRGGLTYLLADIVHHYTIERSFRIHPYQFATNLPRQISANRETTVFKLVLKTKP